MHQARDTPTPVFPRWQSLDEGTALLDKSCPSRVASFFLQLADVGATEIDPTNNNQPHQRRNRALLFTRFLLQFSDDLRRQLDRRCNMISATDLAPPLQRVDRAFREQPTHSWLRRSRSRYPSNCHNCLKALS